MKSLNEWNAVKLTFQEKLTLLQNRIYNISSVYSKLKLTTPIYQTVNVAYNDLDELNVKKLTKEIDEIWNEIKSDLIQLKKD
jgi:hypothetical protein